MVVALRNASLMFTGTAPAFSLRAESEAQRAARVMQTRFELSTVREQASSLEDAVTRLEDALELSYPSGETTNRTKRIEAAIGSFADAYTRIYWGEASGSTLGGLRDDVEALTVAATGGEGPRYNTAFGLEFAFEDGDTAARFDQYARLRYREAFRTDPSTVTEFFVGSPASLTDGLLPKIKGRLARAQDEAMDKLGSRGLNVNRVA